MLPAALALIGLAALGIWSYPRILERRERRRLAVGPDGVVLGAAPIALPRSEAPGILLLHGGGDTPQVLADLAEYLHERGFSVRVPLLSGHGRGLPDFAATSAAEWIEDARREFEAIRATHAWVAVVGLSLGGALAIKLAAARDDIPALVLLAPYVAMPAALRGMAATSLLWGWLFPYFTSRGSRSIRDPVAAARTLGRGIFTPAALRALYDVMTEAARVLPLVKTPTLVVQSRDDNRISPREAERAFARLGATDKRLVWVEGAGHVITVDFGRERVFALTADWLERHRPPSG